MNTVKEINDKRDFTASSLAEAAGVDHSHISRLCREGRIDCRKFGNYWFIPYEVGRLWIEEREARLAAQTKI